MILTKLRICRTVTEEDLMDQTDRFNQCDQIRRQKKEKKKRKEENKKTL